VLSSTALETRKPFFCWSLRSERGVGFRRRFHQGECMGLRSEECVGHRRFRQKPPLHSGTALDLPPIAFNYRGYNPPCSEMDGRFLAKPSKPGTLLGCLALP
jgi:hypothetical protein